MGAGDIALNILLAASDTASAVVEGMASTYDASLMGMIDATIPLNDYLAGLGEQAFTTGVGFDGLATSLASVTVSDDVLTASLAETTTALATTNTALTETAVKADTSSASFDILSASEDAAAASAETLGTALKMAAISLAVIGVAGAAAGTLSLKMAGDFQSGLTSLVTGAGEAESSIGLLHTKILQMSIDTGTSTKDLVAGMYMIDSAGFTVAKGGLLVLQAASEGARVGMASLADVANGVTTALSDYHLPASQAVAVTNDLIATVAAGKTHMADLATAMSTILPTSSAVGVSLRDTSAAMATMTGEGTNAASAATYLRQLLIALEAPAKKGADALKAIGLTTGEVSTEMKKSLPGTLQMIMDHLAQTYTVGSPQYIEALKNIAGGSRQMQGILELTGTHLQTFKDNLDAISAAVQKGGTSITGWNLVQQDFNFRVEQAWRAIQALFIVIGSQLLPVVGKIVGSLTPVISSFIDWLGKTNAVGNAANAVVGFIHQLVDAFNQVFNPVKQVAVVMKPLTDSFDRATGIFHQVKQAAQPLLDSFDRAHGIIDSTAKAVNPMLDSFDRATGVFNKTTPAAHGTVQAVNPFVGLFQGIKMVIQAAIPIVQGIGTAIQFVGQHWQQIQSVISTVGGIIGTVIHAIGVAIDFVKQHIGQVLPVFQAVGNFLVSTFKPVLDQLKSSWTQLVAAITPIMPQLKMVGQAILIAAGIVLVFIVGALAGLITMLANVLTGVIQFVTGVVQLFSGLVQFFTGAINFIVDLFTGQFDKMGTDLATMMGGLSTMFYGALNMIVGFFTATIGAIIGFVSGFASTIINIFIGLWNTLVGHSIIPDMVNGIVQWFAQLPGRAIGAVQSLAGNLIGFFSGLAGQAVSWGSNIIQGLINGINSMIGNVSNAVGNIASIIGSFLPHSPAKRGELSHLNEYGPALVMGIANGITRTQPLLHSTMSNLVSPMGELVKSSNGNAFALRGNAGNVFALGNGGQTIVIQVQPAKADITMDHRKVGEGVMHYASREIRLQAGVRNK